MTDQPESVKPTMPSGPSFFGMQMPEKLGSYRLDSVLGKGGMGLVIKAWDENLDRPVALKVISKDYLQHEDSLIRLQSEAKAAAQMVHHNIVSVYSYGKEGEWPYIAMEYVEGQDLSAWVKKNGAMMPEKAIGYIRQASEALSYAANRSLVHRDIKPANLMLGDDGTLKVMDFGIAKRIDIDMGLTASGAILGTPDYMSPEQTLGHKLDFRSDMYSLGLTLFTLINGMKPYVGDTPFKVMHCHVNEPLPIPDDWGKLASGRLVPVLIKMTAKDPDDRFDSWDSLINELYQIEVSFFGSDSVSAPRTVAPTTMAQGVDSFSQSVKAQKKSGVGLKTFITAALVIAVIAVLAGGAVMFFKGRNTRFPERIDTTPISTVAPKISKESIVAATAAPPPTPAPTPDPTPMTSIERRPNNQFPVRQGRPGLNNNQQRPGMPNQMANRPSPPVGQFMAAFTHRETFLTSLYQGDFNEARQLLQDRQPIRNLPERPLNDLLGALETSLKNAEKLDRYLRKDLGENPTREERLKGAELYLEKHLSSGGTETHLFAGMNYLLISGDVNAVKWDQQIRQKDPSFPGNKPFYETLKLLHQEIRKSQGQ